MGRNKGIYKSKRRAHGEGQAKFCTVNVKEEVTQEFKLLVKAYSDVYGQKMTPTQVIKRLMDAGVKRCDPDVHAVFQSLKEEGVAPEPVLEIIHPVDPTEGEVWDMKYYFEKDGEQLEAEWAKSDKASFSVKLNNRYYGVKEMQKKGWLLKNEVGIEITEEQAMEIARKRRRHLEEVAYQAEKERWEKLDRDSDIAFYESESMEGYELPEEMQKYIQEK